MDEAKGEETAPALGVSLELQYAGGRKVVMQTHLPQTASSGEIDALLDKLNYSADRQEAFYAQEQARRQLEVEENALTNIQERFGFVDAKYNDRASGDGRRVPKLSDNDVKERKQALDNVEASKKRVATCKAYLAELIAKAGNRDGAASTANS